MGRVFFKYLMEWIINKVRKGQLVLRNKFGCLIQKIDRDSLLYLFVSKGDIKLVVDKFLLYLYSCVCL